MGNVKIFGDKQINRQTDKPTSQKLNVPDISMQGHKNESTMTKIYVHIFAYQGIFP